MGVCRVVLATEPGMRPRVEQVARLGVVSEAAQLLVSEVMPAVDCCRKSGEETIIDPPA